MLGLVLQVPIGFADSHSFAGGSSFGGTNYQPPTWDSWTNIQGTIESVHSRGNYKGIDGAFKLEGQSTFIRLYGLVPSSTFQHSDLLGLEVACNKLKGDQLDEPTETTVSLNCYYESDGQRADLGQKLVREGKAVDVCGQFVLGFEDCIALFAPTIFGQ